MSDEIRNDENTPKAEQAAQQPDTENLETPAQPAEGEKETEVEKRYFTGEIRKERKKTKVMSGGKKLLIGLALVAAAAVLVVGLTLIFNKIDADKALNEPQVSDNVMRVIDVKPADIAKIQIERSDGGTIVITSPKEDTYVVEGMEPDTVSMDICTSIYNCFSALNAAELVTENVHQPEVYGLSVPSARATATFRDGSTRTVLVGDQLTTSTNYYLMEEGTQTVYTVTSFMANRLSSTATDLHERTLPTVDTTNGKSLIIKLRGQDAYKMRAKGAQASTLAAWQMIEPRTIDVNINTVNDYIEGIGAVSLSSCVQINASAADLASKYGFTDGEGDIALTYVDTNNVSRYIEIGARDPESGNFYVRRDKTNDVYMTTYAMLEFALNFSFGDLIEPYPSMYNIAQVDQMTLTTGDGASYVLRIDRKQVTKDDGTSKTEETFFLNGVQKPEKAFKEAYKAIIGVPILSLAKANKEAEVDMNAPTLKLEIQLNNDEGAATVEYFPYDVTGNLIRKNGDVLGVATKDAVDLIVPALETLKATPME